MDNIKNDSYCLKKIKEDLEYIIEISKDLTKEDFEKSILHQDSAMFRMVQISENSDRLSKDFKEWHKEIDWRSLKGMRNKIVHEYGAVDLKIIFDTIKTDIPQFYDIIKNLV